MLRKILIMGLPGAGKTTLATALAPLLNAVVFNADAVRANLSRDLGFDHKDRIEHARRMGWMCDRVAEAGGTVIADFICPTAETRAAFGEAFTVWLDRIEAGRFEDTNRMFVAPERFDLRVKAEGTPQYWAEQALAMLRPPSDPQKPIALFIGRYQAFHARHQRLIEEGCGGSDRSASRFVTPTASTLKIHCFTLRSSSASRQRSRPMTAASWWCRGRTSPTSSMAAASAMSSSALCLTRRSRRSPHPRYAH
jgi:hypothetical protein